MLDKKTFLAELISSCNYRMGERVLVAVSGGIDSVVLAHLLLSLEIPVETAHVNYGLRGKESDADEKFVKDFSKKAGVPFHLKKCLKKEINKNTPGIQETARDLRYEFFHQLLEERKLKYVAVAHHRDDNIETVLLNFVRGSGLRGLTGMRSRSGTTIRPLLNFARTDIEAYAKKNKLKFRKDSSNDEDIYTRNLIRNNFLSAIPKKIPQGTKGMIISMNRLLETEQLLGFAMKQWVQLQVNEVNGMQFVNIEPLRDRMNLHFFAQWLRKLGFNTTQVTTIRENISKGKSPFMISSRNFFLNRDREKFWIGSKAQTSPKKKLLVEETPAPRSTFINTSCAYIDASRVGELTHRAWQHGDRMIPFGMKGNKNVSDILNEMKVPPHEKTNYQVVISGDDIVWIPGYRIADKFRVTNETRRVLRLEFE